MVQYFKALGLALLLSGGVGSVGQAENDSIVSNVSDYEGATVQIISNINNILVAKISSIPNGPNPKLDEQCERLTVKPELKSAMLIYNKGWAITSQIVYGPYQIVSFAGDFEKVHTWCIRKKTNIAIFHDESLLAIIYTKPENETALGSLELLETGHIGIYPTYIYHKKHVANLTFRNNEISINLPSYSMACGVDGIVPNINGLDIKKARKILFDYGWLPRNGKEIDGMGDMELGYSEQRSETPELVSCGGGGFYRCYYAYQTTKSYLDVVTSGEPNPTVSGVDGSCKF